jgi:hypothetical protein|uniref:Uncharacterized protein n=1 Tax=Fagus sylvatica TaxID=28930 RepID=A0A2N9EVY3_FAGSY
MLLVFTAMLLLISMPAHEAILILPKEQNIMNKNHLGLLHRAYVPQSTMASVVHKVSPSRRQLLKNQASPSAPNPDTEIPSSLTGKNAAPLRGSQQKSPPPPSMPGGGSSIP